MRKARILLILAFIFPGGLLAQRANLQHTMLWQIKDPATKKVSYLFGTIHIFGASWLDSITTVKDKFLQSKHVFVEVNARLDSNIVDSFKRAYDGPAIIPSKIFSDKIHPIVNNYVKSIGWGDIDTLFDKNPQPVLTLIALDWQLITDYTSRFHVMAAGEDNLDTYFAKQAVASGKVVTALDDELNIIANLGKKQDPSELAKDIGELAAALQSKRDSLIKKYDDVLDYKNLRYNYYLNKDAPNDDENGGLDGTKRNDLWMPKLSEALRGGDCFIAAGIAHLNYKKGLINQLRKAGFEVTPVQIDRTPK